MLTTVGHDLDRFTYIGAACWHVFGYAIRAYTAPTNEDIFAYMYTAATNEDIFP